MNEELIDIIQKAFWEFLKAENAGEAFIDNAIDELGAYAFGSYMNRRMRNNSPALLTGAFSWAETKQGAAYWSSLDNKWKDVLKELYDKHQ